MKILFNFSKATPTVSQLRFPNCNFSGRNKIHFLLSEAWAQDCQVKQLCDRQPAEVCRRPEFSILSAAPRAALQSDEVIHGKRIDIASRSLFWRPVPDLHRCQKYHSTEIAGPDILHPAGDCYIFRCQCFNPCVRWCSCQNNSGFRMCAVNDRQYLV